MSKIKYNRQFEGTLITRESYPEILSNGGRNMINFHNKHLKAYKQGKETFTHGWRVNEEGERLGPQYHKVQEKIE